jgi:prophage regulatory protein
MPTTDSNNLLTMDQVLKLTGFKSRTTIYNRLKKHCMPPPCSVGLGQIRWRERDIAEWIDNLRPNAQS